MKNVFFSLAFMLIGSFAFANTQTVEKQKNVTIENCNEKFSAKYNLGNVTSLTETELITLCDNLMSQKIDFKDVDECTITLTAEVNVGFGSVSVSVSYTASNCETAMKKAGAALSAAVKKVKELAAAY